MHGVLKCCHWTSRGVEAVLQCQTPGSWCKYSENLPTRMYFLKLVRLVRLSLPLWPQRSLLQCSAAHGNALKWPPWAKPTRPKSQGEWVQCNRLVRSQQKRSFPRPRCSKREIEIILKSVQYCLKLQKNTHIGWCAGPSPKAVWTSHVPGDDLALGVLPRASPVSQPTYGWPGASLVTQELSAGVGGAQEDLVYYGPGANGSMCPIFWGSEESKGAHKNNVFNSTEWNNTLKLCWNPILGFYNPQNLINFRDLCKLEKN